MNEGEKLLQRMLKSQQGWRERDLETLYLSFRFEYKEATRHRKYWHPEHPELYAFVPRHRNVKASYVLAAIRLISRLKEIEHDNE